MTDTNPQGALFEPEISAVSVMARMDHPWGWRVVIGYRRGDNDHWTSETYSELSYDEAADVIAAATLALLSEV